MNVNNYGGIVNGESAHIEGGAKVVNRTENHINPTQNITNSGTIGNVVGQADAVHAQQNVGYSVSDNLPELREELAKLQEALAARATEPEQFDEVAAVARARKASEEKNPAGVKAALEGARDWALKVAQEIGTKLAIEAIKHSLGV